MGRQTEFYERWWGKKVKREKRGFACARARRRHSVTERRGRGPEENLKHKTWKVRQQTKGQTSQQVLTSNKPLKEKEKRHLISEV